MNTWSFRFPIDEFVHVKFSGRKAGLDSRMPTDKIEDVPTQLLVVIDEGTRPQSAIRLCNMI